MKRIALIIPLLFLITLFLPRCAVVVPPTGGDKDTIAPRMIRSNPPIYSTNFKGERVLLTFDEYIKLDQISQKLILSPPQERLPEFRIRGKSLQLNFFEDLLDSTTYTLYFSDAIADNNEGNKLKNFEFAFSTGPEIDSLRYRGKVIDAFTQQPQEGVLVMLYNRITDSVPILELPRYVTKSDKDGRFVLSNLQANSYKLFALRDENSNYKFDQITESIAFHSNIVDTSMLYSPSADTIPVLFENLLTMRLFQEENRVQSLTDFSRTHRRRLSFGFSRRPEGSFSIKPINAIVDSTKSWYVIEKNEEGDSLKFWLLDNQLSNIDTLRFVATYLKTDSIMNLVQTSDTLRLFYFPKPQASSRLRRGSDDEEKKPTLTPQVNLLAGAPAIPNQKLTLTFGVPLQSIDTSLFWLENITDSTLIEPITLEVDTLNPRQYHLEYAWKSLVKYQFTAMPSAFTNLDGLSNDTLIYNFEGANPEKFGIINLNLTGVQPNIIVDLLNPKGELVQSKVIEQDGVLSFKYLRPGNYSFRFIFDQNQNNKWDTGRYLMGIQPERVVIFEEDKKPKEIQVRANWEYDIDYNLN